MLQEPQELMDVSQIAPGSTGQVCLAGTWRPFLVLARRGNWALLEYWRSDPGRALSSGLRLLDLSAWQQGEERDRRIGYRQLSHVWVQTLVETGVHWRGRPLRGAPVPAPVELFAHTSAEPVSVLQDVQVSA